jgi:hypothetical protein
MKMAAAKKRKLSIALLAMFCLALAIVGMTYAFTRGVAQQTNALHSHTTSVKIIEETDGDLTVGDCDEKKEVYFQNTGSSSVFLRATFAESWSGGKDWIPLDASLVYKNWTPSALADWELKDDGWYYYKKVLPAGASTEKILTFVRFANPLPAPYDDAEYSLHFQVEACQASDEAAVNTAATIAVFGRAATVTGEVTSGGALVAGTVSWA